MKVIALAAGFATRLYPLTRKRAKPLLEVRGRAVLSHLLDRARAIESVDEIVVVTNHRFHAQFEEWRHQEPRRVPIRLIDDGTEDAESRLGGVADLELAWSTLADDADVTIVAGDNLIEGELTAHASRFAAHGEPLILARRVPGGVPPGRHGEVCVDSGGVVTSFREKPVDPRSDLAATCLYFFPAAVRAHVRQYLAEGGDRDAPGHFIAWLCARTRVRAEVLDARLHDIGNLESLERARTEYPG